MRRHLATCTLCEAACGIVVEEDGAGAITSVRGDPDDPMSRGYVCPKVVGMQDLHEDPDRLRHPLVRDGAGFREASWEEALERAAEGLRRVRKEHGQDALAVYQGNPTAHNLGLMTVGQAVFRTLGTKNLYSASTADQAPHMLAAHEMFGHVLFMPVPDIDRTKHLLILGANPLVSNGSIMTAPDFRRRMAEIRARGGRIIVVDPRRTETGRAADEHVFLRPGTDALFLLSMIDAVLSLGLARPGEHVAGTSTLANVARQFPAERTALATGVPSEVTRRLAREFASTDPAVCYGRIGVCHQEHGTLASWLVYALNAITGNMDRPGGSMWATPAAELVWIADLFGLAGYARFSSRVRGLPEIGGELPIGVLAEEIETKGVGQIRALITCAGNPALSAPNGKRLERAFGTLEHMVCIDPYLNETTRHAQVILPPTSPLQRSHYDLALQAFAVRNGAKYVAPPLPKGKDERHDWEIILELGARLRVGNGAMHRAVTPLLDVARKLGPEGIVDLALRVGPYGLTLKKLREEPHGIDLGALEPRLPKMLRTKDKKVQLAPERFLREIPELVRSLDEATRASADALGREGRLVLVGRRSLRSNNSWLHNTERLVKGRTRCTLRIHPEDALARGLDHGTLAEIETTRGTLTLPVEVSDEMMRGVVSVPHGYGHHRDGTRTRVATAHAGVSVNDVTDEHRLDRLSGNAAFSGQHVVVRAAAARAAAE